MYWVIFILLMIFINGFLLWSYHLDCWDSSWSFLPSFMLMIFFVPIMIFYRACTTYYSSIWSDLLIMNGIILCCGMVSIFVVLYTDILDPNFKDSNDKKE